MKTQIKDTKSEQLVGETIARPLDAKNGIMPGATLTQKIRGNRLSLKDFGFFLKTLELMSDCPRIGGHTGRGFGEFAAEWRLRARINGPIGRVPFVDIGTVKLAETDFTLPNHDIVAKALAAFEEMIADPAVDFDFAVAA
jgi:hypothetical protein